MVPYWFLKIMTVIVNLMMMTPSNRYFKTVPNERMKELYKDLTIRIPRIKSDLDHDLRSDMNNDESIS